MIKTIYIPMRGAGSQDIFDDHVNKYLAAGYRLTERRIIDGYMVGEKTVLPVFYAEMENDQIKTNADILMAFALKLRSEVKPEDGCENCPLYVSCMDGTLDLGRCPSEWEFPWDGAEAVE